MNTLILRSNQLIAGGRAKLDARQQTHLKDILGVKTGDEIRIGELNGLLGRAIIATDDCGLVLQDCMFDSEPPRAIAKNLILALPRPHMIKRIFQTIATFGVTHCSLIQTQRVEKSFWQSPALEKQAIYHQLLLGLEQANATQMPSISFHKRFKPFIEDECSAMTEGTKKVILEPGNSPALSLEADRNISLAIGPEGGFTRYELERFAEFGFEQRHLGERILRVETAVTACLARLI
jgi:RsmE family RNA methyltransferase